LPLAPPCFPLTPLLKITAALGALFAFPSRPDGFSKTTAQRDMASTPKERPGCNNLARFPAFTALEAR